MAPEELIHIRLNASSDAVLGLSPMYVASRAIEQQEASSRWNTATMRNRAIPSMAIKLKQVLTTKQRRDLKEDLYGKYQGYDNAGQVMLLPDEMDVVPMGYTAVEMDYANGMIMNSREIAVAYGVPSELVGDVSNKTYANATEAGRQFAMNTILPLLDLMYGSIWAGISPMYKDVSSITYDVEQIRDLSGDQTPMMSALTNANFLTTNEKRRKLGYDDIGPEGDVILTGMGLVPLSESVTPAELPPMGNGDTDV